MMIGIHRIAEHICSIYMLVQMNRSVPVSPFNFLQYSTIGTEIKNKTYSYQRFSLVLISA